MTGGIEETFELQTLNPSQQRTIFPILNQSYQKNSIISCSIAVSISFMIHFYT